MMRYKLLGNSGLRVSELCLGTMTFGESWGFGTSASNSHAMLDLFFAAGGNFIDTANMYTDGESETIIGQWLASRGRRERAVIGTKFTQWMPGSDDPNISGNSRKAMVEAVEASLRRLRTDHIDLYWLHAWDFTTRPEEVMRGLDDLIRAGKILYPAISDTPAWVIAQCNTLAELRGWSPFVANQIEYSLLQRDAERDLIPMSKSLDIAVVAWSPLGRGLLTGKYQTDCEGHRGRLDVTKATGRSAEQTAVIEAVVRIAASIGVTPAQVALAWTLARGAIPIIGATSSTQLESNLAALAVSINEEHRGELDRLSAIDRGFPHNFPISARASVYAGFYDRLVMHREQGAAP